MSDWKIEKDFATRETPSPFAQRTEVELAGDAFTIDCTIGSGYMRESTTATVPVRVIAILLRNAGYTVEWPQSGKEP